MRLTKKKAIELSVELWTWLSETGKRKWEWPNWNPSVEIVHFCFLCEYADRHGGCGADCPYHQKFPHCCREDTPYACWEEASTAEDKKKCARLFLEQLKQL